MTSNLGYSDISTNEYEYRGLEHSYYDLCVMSKGWDAKNVSATKTDKQIPLMVCYSHFIQFRIHMEWYKESEIYKKKSRVAWESKMQNLKSNIWKIEVYNIQSKVQMFWHINWTNLDQSNFFEPLSKGKKQ